ncbi:MAG: hypothetical protein WBP44_15440 [Gammaproteobacteria bacterium]
MADPGRHLALIIPGLCGPDTDAPVSDYLTTRPAALDRLLSRSRAEKFPATDLDSTLCLCFGLDARQQALPLAALTWLADTGEAAGGCILRADPVHLRADQSCLRLFDSHTFPVTQEEADALAAAVAQFYRHLDWQLQAVRPQRWYLTLPAAPAISTRSVMQVAGQDIDPYLPQGHDAADWHAIMNEVQMLLHDHPVNIAREKHGTAAINSLWFWGGGELPTALHTDVMRVATDYPLAMGLAQLAGIARVDVPADTAGLMDFAASGLSLLVADELERPARYGEVDRWLERLLQLEQHCFVPLLRALRQGELASLAIYPCNGKCFHITRRLLHGFWKRDRPFESVCRHD